MRWLGGGRDESRAAPARGGGRSRRSAGANGSGRRATRRKRSASRRGSANWGVIWLRVRFAGLGLVVLGVVAGGAWVWTSGMVGRQWAALGDAVEHMAMRGGLVVRSVTVEGRERTSSTRLLAALGTGRGEPILGFDPHAARSRVEALPWVASARIERRLPDSIHVVLTERAPLALWQRGPDGDFAVIDSTGLPLEADTRPFADLPVIVGAKAPAQVPALMDLLATQPDLADRVRAATWVGGRRWTLRLDSIEDGIDVDLPEQDPVAAWSRLARLERQGHLLARYIDRVDLRLPDRLVVRPDPSLGFGTKPPEGPAGARHRALVVSTGGQET